ncbi:aminotransferase-like domain-containing protein [Agilicoccus flavus]|uniref:aminotransferase-like domain-containing protein n=1 Tax=Agilicoccus flavus TaxID=2775968 RepID=UPI001CF701FB|nr:PLP-dependent aminotransferase family protein [Agilicoccus flavus]
MKDSSSSADVIAGRLAAEVGPLAPGTRLPSQRELVRRFGASATTIAQALNRLALAGLLETRPGAGTFRAARTRPRTGGDTAWQEAALELTEGLAERPTLARRFAGSALADTLTATAPDTIDLNGGYLHPTLQPAGLLASALTRVSRRPEAWERPPAAGVPALRDWFAQDIGGGLDRHDVLVAPGGQSALATALRALTGPGDAVVVEAPTYPGTIAAAAAASLRAVPTPLDARGIIPDHLDEALTRSRARVVVVQPLHQNPTGTAMDAERRREVRDVARRHRAFLVEDDFARHLTHPGAWSPPPPLVDDDPDGTVVHIRSLTKISSPNLRVAALAARGPVLGRLRAALTVDTLLVPAVLQHTALEVVTAPGWRRSVTALQRELRDRCHAASAALVDALGEDVLPHRPRGGYHLWVALPGGRAGTDVARDAAAAGVAVTPGRNYYAPGNDERPFVRLSYVAAPTPRDVETAAGRLVDMIRGPGGS